VRSGHGATIVADADAARRLDIHELIGVPERVQLKRAKKAKTGEQKAPKTPAGGTNMAKAAG
jgi:hypothetical protein